jgi:hypothetical protein
VFTERGPKSVLSLEKIMDCKHKFIPHVGGHLHCGKCGMPKPVRETGEGRKRAGIAKVVGNPAGFPFSSHFWPFAWRWISRRPRGTWFTFDQIVGDYRRHLLPREHHCNLIGGLSSAIATEAIREGIVRALDVPVRSRIRTNNARKVTAYERL